MIYMYVALVLFILIGLCFSVLPGVATPPSLQNMYKELETDIPGFQIPSHGYLMGWARQGQSVTCAYTPSYFAQSDFMRMPDY